MMILATFAQWLSEQETRPEGDKTGELARLWKSFEGDRPRVSSPTGIQRWLITQQVEGGEQLIQAAVAEYHARRGDLRVIGADDSKVTVMLEDIIRRLGWVEQVLRMAFDLDEHGPDGEVVPPWAESALAGKIAAVQYADPATGQPVVQQLPMTAAAEAAAAEARAIRERVTSGQQDGGWQALWDTADFTEDEVVQ